MLNRIRSQVGTAGLIVAVVALVAALGGSAIAANTASDSAKRNKRAKNKKGTQGGLNAKQKRQVIALAKRFASAGPQGPQGPQGVPGLPGAPGAKGADGDDGSDGSNGSDGQDGDSVESTELLAGDLNCPEGGTQFDVGGDTTYACNGAQGAPGADGSPWTMGGTLPAGATEVGRWAFSGTYPGLQIMWTGISFSIPLADADVPDAINERRIVQEGATPPSECEDDDANPDAGPGNPEADPGYICVFVQDLTGSQGGNLAFSNLSAHGAEVGAASSISGGFGKGNGSFAVTAPLP